MRGHSDVRARCGRSTGSVIEVTAREVPVCPTSGRGSECMQTCSDTPSAVRRDTATRSCSSCFARATPRRRRRGSAQRCVNGQIVGQCLHRRLRMLILRRWKRGPTSADRTSVVPHTSGYISPVPANRSAASGVRSQMFAPRCTTPRRRGRRGVLHHRSSDPKLRVAIYMSPERATCAACASCRDWSAAQRIAAITCSASSSLRRTRERRVPSRFEAKMWYAVPAPVS